MKTHITRLILKSTGKGSNPKLHLYDSLGHYRNCTHNYTRFASNRYSYIFCSYDWLFQLCWHPEKEGLLGYGTDDGRVGIYDLFAKLVRCVVVQYKQAISNWIRLKFHVITKRHVFAGIRNCRAHSTKGPSTAWCGVPFVFPVAATLALE